MRKVSFSLQEALRAGGQRPVGEGPSTSWLVIPPRAQGWGTRPHSSGDRSPARPRSLSQTGLTRLGALPLADPGHSQGRETSRGAYGPLSHPRASPTAAEDSQCSCTPRRPSPSPSGSRTVWDRQGPDIRVAARSGCPLCGPLPPKPQHPYSPPRSSRTGPPGPCTPSTRIG